MDLEGGIVVNGVFYENPVFAYDRIQKESIEVDTDGSETVNFYKGKSLLITGGTGFMGKVTVEKLLRVCPEVDSIFMLIREKKGRGIHERLDVILNDPLFSYLNEKNPKFRYKLIPISGDVALPDLGISNEDRKLLTSKVQIIIHAAASVNLDSKLKSILEVNFFGTQRMLKFAKECCSLESFVVVSTAFAPCGLKVIEEKHYPPLTSPDELLEMIEGKSDDEIEELVPKLLANTYPNTYQFSKAVVERFLEQNCDGLPLVIFRPSIITPIYKEPLPGWTDNMYGPTGIQAAAAVGLIHTLHIKNQHTLVDIVPVDYCVNAMLVAAAKEKSFDCLSHIANLYLPNETNNILYFYEIGNSLEANFSLHKVSYYSQSRQVQIYNYTSGCENPMDWNAYSTYCHRFIEQVPTKKGFWFPFTNFPNNYYIYCIEAFIYHNIFGVIADLLLIILGKRPIMIKVYKKIHRHCKVSLLIMSYEWKWTNTNIQSLWRNMSENDRRVFPFCIKTLDWPEYCKILALGIRKYVIKEDLTTLVDGKRKRQLFQIAHYTVCCLVAFLLYGLLSRVFNLIIS